MNPLRVGEPTALFLKISKYYTAPDGSFPILKSSDQPIPGGVRYVLATPAIDAAAEMLAALRAALPILEDEAECRLHSYSTIPDCETDAEALASMTADDRAYCLPIMASATQIRAAIAKAEGGAAGS